MEWNLFFLPSLHLLSVVPKDKAILDLSTAPQSSDQHNIKSLLVPIYYEQSLA